MSSSSTPKVSGSETLKSSGIVYSCSGWSSPASLNRSAPASGPEELHDDHGADHDGGQVAAEFREELRDVVLEEQREARHRHEGGGKPITWAAAVPRAAPRGEPQALAEEARRDEAIASHPAAKSDSTGRPPRDHEEHDVEEPARAPEVDAEAVVRALALRAKTPKARKREDHRELEQCREATAATTIPR
jgi:hypothetical protein